MAERLSEDLDEDLDARAERHVREAVSAQNKRWGNDVELIPAIGSFYRHRGAQTPEEIANLTTAIHEWYANLHADDVPSAEMAHPDSL